MRNDVDITLLDEDLKSRYYIVNNVDENYFVEASAGSGKTYSLTQRLVSMIESGKDIRKITTITFTKAAANEFFERFQNLLSVRCKESDTSKPLRPTDLPYTTELSRKRCAEALANIDLCFMGTIDSFCNTLAKEHPVEIGIPANSKVMSDEEFKQQLLIFYADILNGKYGNDLSDEGVAFNELLGKDSKDAFVEGISFIMQHRDSTLLLPPCGDEKLDAAIEDKKDLLFSIIDEVETNQKHIKKGKPQDYFDYIETNKKKLNGTWEGKSYDVKKVIDSLNNLKFEKTVQGTSIENKEIVVLDGKVWSFNKEKTEPILIALDDFVYNRSLHFLQAVSMLVDKEFKLKGYLTFFDYLYHLRNTLKYDAEFNEGKLARQIYEKHQYYLIDESQDTNPLQTELMFYLTAKVPCAKWDECEPINGSLFIVGDPKQSIYRFRGADVKAFEYTRELFRTKDFGEVLYMTRNFRSTRVIREWLNKAMPPLLDVQDGVENCEHKLIPIDKDEEKEKIESQIFTGVYKYFVNKKGQSTNKPDAEAVLNIIRSLVYNPKYKTWDKDEKVVREIKYRDIMVISSSKSIIEHLKIFLANNIPFNAEGRTLFENSKALTELKIFLKVFFNPTDKTSIIELLQSKQYNFDLRDLYDLYDSKYSFILGEEYNGSNLKVKSAIEELNDTYSKVKDLSIPSMFMYFMNNLNIFENFGVDFLECVYYTLAILEDLASNGSITNANDLVEVLDGISANNADYERCLSFAAKLDCIKIANVHKVKGLQAPICILAQPLKKPRSVNSVSLRNDKETETTLFTITKESDFGTELKVLSTSYFDDKLATAEKYSQAEKRRIEYVAATRAESALIISTCKDSNTWNDILSTDPDIEDFLIPENETKFENEEIDIQKLTHIDNKEIEVIDPKNSIKQSYKVVKPSKVKVLRKDIEKELDEDQLQIPDLSNDETKNESINKAFIGTITHRLMEQLCNSKGTLDFPSIFVTIKNEYGFETNNYYSLLLDVYNVMTSSGYEQNDGSTANLLNEVINAEEVITEVPFSYKKGNSIFNGYIDLIYKKDNDWFIVDYKTNIEEDSIKLLEEYKGQLSIYEEAFKNGTDNIAKARIYHISLDLSLVK